MRVLHASSTIMLVVQDRQPLQQLVELCELRSTGIHMRAAMLQLPAHERKMWCGAMRW
jgi:hypothetical protein